MTVHHHMQTDSMQEAITELRELAEMRIQQAANEAVKDQADEMQMEAIAWGKLADMLEMNGKEYSQLAVLGV